MGLRGETTEEYRLAKRHRHSGSTLLSTVCFFVCVTLIEMVVSFSVSDHWTEG